MQFIKGVTAVSEKTQSSGLNGENAALMHYGKACTTPQSFDDNARRNPNLRPLVRPRNREPHAPMFGCLAPDCRRTYIAYSRIRRRVKGCKNEVANLDDIGRPSNSMAGLKMEFKWSQSVLSTIGSDRGEQR